MTTLGDYALMSSPHNKIRYVDDINVYKLSEIWSGMFILDPPVACLPVACLPVFLPSVFLLPVFLLPVFLSLVFLKIILYVIMSPVAVGEMRTLTDMTESLWRNIFGFLCRQFRLESSCRLSCRLSSCWLSSCRLSACRLSSLKSLCA